MSASPIIPGVLYQVRQGHHVKLIEAANGADAIFKFLDEVVL